MPVQSQKQYRYVMYLRNKYGTEAKAPKEDRWAFSSEWTSGVSYKNLPEKVDGDDGIVKYEPKLLGEMMISSSVGATPETPLKKWQAPVNDKTKNKRSGKIKVVKPQGSK
jgi:hypothetical protein